MSLNRDWFRIMGSRDEVSVTKIPMYQALENCFYDLKKILSDYENTEILASNLQIEQYGGTQPNVTAYLLTRRHRRTNLVTSWQDNKEHLDETLQKWLANRKSCDKYPSEEEINGVKEFLSYLDANQLALVDHDFIRIHDDLKKASSVVSS